jgi:hypothetical protein
MCAVRYGILIRRSHNNAVLTVENKGASTGICHQDGDKNAPAAYEKTRFYGSMRKLKEILLARPNNENYQKMGKEALKLRKTLLGN